MDKNGIDLVGSILGFKGQNEDDKKTEYLLNDVLNNKNTLNRTNNINNRVNINRSNNANKSGSVIDTVANVFDKIGNVASKIGNEDQSMYNTENVYQKITFEQALMRLNGEYTKEILMDCSNGYIKSFVQSTEAKFRVPFKQITEMNILIEYSNSDYRVKSEIDKYISDYHNYTDRIENIDTKRFEQLIISDTDTIKSYLINSNSYNIKRFIKTIENKLDASFNEVSADFILSEYKKTDYKTKKSIYNEINNAILAGYVAKGISTIAGGIAGLFGKLNKNKEETKEQPKTQTSSSQNNRQNTQTNTAHKTSSQSNAQNSNNNSSQVNTQRPQQNTSYQTNTQKQSTQNNVNNTANKTFEIKEKNDILYNAEKHKNVLYGIIYSVDCRINEIKSLTGSLYNYDIDNLSNDSNSMKMKIDNLNKKSDLENLIKSLNECIDRVNKYYADAKSNSKLNSNNKSVLLDMLDTPVKVEPLPKVNIEDFKL